MKYATLIGALVLFIYALFNNMNEEIRNGIDDEAFNDKVTLRFMAATAAFDEFYHNNPTVSGDVTDQVVYPDWLPDNAEIKMAVTGGVGYVYSPASKGVYSKLLIKTGGSSFMGYSDATSINTPSGKIPKPTYIKPDSIVYVR